MEPAHDIRLRPTETQQARELNCRCHCRLVERNHRGDAVGRCNVSRESGQVASADIIGRRDALRTQDGIFGLVEETLAPVGVEADRTVAEGAVELLDEPGRVFVMRVLDQILGFGIRGPWSACRPFRGTQRANYALSTPSIHLSPRASESSE